MRARFGATIHQHGVAKVMNVPSQSRGRVCHFSSVHPANDIRVFRKECETLVAAGFDVSLIAVSAPMPETRVKVVPLPREGGRIKRMLSRSRAAYKLALAERAQIYHFHDPELLPYAYLLKRKTGAKVVYDSHENYVEDIYSKVWISPRLRPLVAKVVAAIENFVVRRLDLVVAATPHIEERFSGIAPLTVTINNYPDSSEFTAREVVSTETRVSICYIGAITYARGIREMLDALDVIHPDVHFDLAGTFASEGIRETAFSHRNWHRVTYHGQIGRLEIGQIFARSFAGMVTLQPVPNHIYAQPIKLFEYMSAGIPPIASNFPFWQRVVVDGDCGVAVDPTDSAAIGAAVNALYADTELAGRLGANGRRLVSERYNWESEGRQLVGIYDALLENGE